MRKLNDLPDVAILSDKEAAEVLGVSLDTLARMTARGDAPPRVQISMRRFGRPVGSLKAWLAKRSAMPSKATRAAVPPTSEPDAA